MSIGLFPVFNPSIDGIRFSSDGVVLIESAEVLDALAGELGVLPFTSFTDTREIPDDFDGDMTELEALLGPWDEWFSLDDGVETANALLRAVGDPESNWSYDEREALLEELREFARCLQAAHGSGARFRIELG